MKNLVELLEKSAKKSDKTKVVLTLRNNASKILWEQSTTLGKFNGGVRRFIKIINNISSCWQDDDLILTVNATEIKFVGGKFGLSLAKIVNTYADFHNGVEDDEIALEYRAKLKKEVYDYFSQNCQNVVSIIELITFVNTTSEKSLKQAVINSNFALLDATK
jgi:hypothetical protein